MEEAVQNGLQRMMGEMSTSDRAEAPAAEPEAEPGHGAKKEGFPDDSE